MSALVEAIPDPGAIQARLGELAREEAVLKRLLPVAIRAREARQADSEEASASGEAVANAR